jgi:hypothetical protein
VNDGLGEAADTLLGVGGADESPPRAGGVAKPTAVGTCTAAEGDEAREIGEPIVAAEHDSDGGRVGFAK